MNLWFFGAKKKIIVLLKSSGLEIWMDAKSNAYLPFTKGAVSFQEVLDNNAITSFVSELKKGYDLRNGANVILGHDVCYGGVVDTSDQTKQQLIVKNFLASVPLENKNIFYRLLNIWEKNYVFALSKNFIGSLLNAMEVNDINPKTVIPLKVLELLDNGKNPSANPYQLFYANDKEVDKYDFYKLFTKEDER